MNKKNIYVCIVVFLSYNIVNFATEFVPKNDDVVITEEIKPEAISVQLHWMFENFMKNMVVCSEFFKQSYNNALGETKVSPSVSYDVKKLPSHNYFSFLETHKYLVATSIISIIVAGLAYKYNFFSTSHKDVLINEEELKELVECVVRDPLISKQDQFNKIFEILLRNGLDNIIIYNDHMFEVSDMFKVEIKGKNVKVTRNV